MRLASAGGARLLLATAFDAQTRLHHFPPPAFGADQMMECLVGPYGKLYTFTRVHQAQGGTSHCLGFADFAGNVRLLGRIRSNTEPQIGDTVVIVAIDPHDFSAGYVFETTDCENV